MNNHSKIKKKTVDTKHCFIHTRRDETWLKIFSKIYTYKLSIPFNFKFCVTIWLIIIVKPVKKERQICLYRFYIWTRDGLLPYKNKRTSLFHLRTFQTPWKRYNICIQINKNTFSSDYIEKKNDLKLFFFIE